MSDAFVATCANWDFAICTLISFNFQLHCSNFVLRVAYTGAILHAEIAVVRRSMPTMRDKFSLLTEIGDIGA